MNHTIIISIFLFACLSFLATSERVIISKGINPVFVPVKGNNFIFGEILRNNATIYDQDGKIKKKFTFGKNLTTFPNFLGLKDGNFLATWRDFSLKGDQDYVQKFDLNGNALTNPYLLDSNHYSHISEGNSIIQLKDEGYVVMWHTAQKDKFFFVNFTFFAQIFNKDDTPRTQKFKVHERSSSFNNYPVYASLDNGDFVIFWSERDQDGIWGVYGQWYNSNGVKGNKVQIHHGNELSIRLQHITTLVPGELLLTWIKENSGSNGYFIYAQVILPDGKLKQSEFLVHSTGINPFTKTVHSAVLSNGRFVISWSGSGPSGIYFQIYEKNSSPHGSPVVVAETSGVWGWYNHPYVAPTQDGGFILTWDFVTETYSEIYAQKFDIDEDLISSQMPKGEKLFLSI